MKQFKQITMMLLAGLAFTACSESEKDVQTPEPDLTSLGNKGYVAFTLSLPTTSSSSTRGDEAYNDGENSGTLYEYEVNSAKLVLFSGDDEATAKFAGAYNLTKPDFKTAGGDQLTSEAIVTQQIDPTLIGAGQLWAYVIVNDNGVAKIATDPKSITMYEKCDPVNDADAADKAKTFSYDAGSTFGDFSQVKLAAKMFTQKVDGKLTNFTMTNAPVADHSGGPAVPDDATKVTTLGKLDKRLIHATEAAAKAAPAGHVDLERAAAKVQVTRGSEVNEGENTIKDTSFKYNTNTFTWAIGNENSCYYNTRQWDNSWNKMTAAGGDEGTVWAATKYRFISGKPIDATLCPDNYRTFWAKDVNYAGEAGAEPLVVNTASIEQKLGNAVYPAENTFDVDYQKFSQTTYLTIKVQIDVNGTGTAADFYTTKTIAANEILTDKDITTDGSLLKYAKAYLEATSEYATFDSEGGSITAYAVTKNADGTATVTLTGSGGTTYTAANLQERLNTALKVKYYANGWTYYSVRIRHFGAGAVAAADGKESGCETPWNKFNHTSNTMDGIYGTSDMANARNNYLGRYGIVRNNWYCLEFGGIKKIGKSTPVTPPTDPSDPDTPDDPDDEVENYISLKLHILPWAVRGIQKFEL